MQQVQKGFPRLRAAVLAGIGLLVALAAVSGTAPATKEDAMATAAAPASPPVYVDPSLAGLSVRDDADPGGYDIETY